MLEVIYEDNQIVVVVKPQNIPTQADISGDKDLLNEVKDYIKAKYNKKGEAFIGLVHRLDRPTGGVMVFARTSKSASRLSAQIQDGTFEKTYFAVVKGQVRQKVAKLENYIKKDERENKARIAGMAEKGAKKSILEYEILETKDDLSLAKIKLETGRGHQIRLQMSNIGLPLFGDAKYGKAEPGQKTSNLALWAGVLSFKHPTEDKTMVFKVYPPVDKLPFSLFDFSKYLKR